MHKYKKNTCNYIYFNLHISLISLREPKILGCRQVVRQRFLVSSFVGSNPATPANKKVLLSWRILLLDSVVLRRINSVRSG